MEISPVKRSSKAEFSTKRGWIVSDADNRFGRTRKTLWGSNSSNNASKPWKVFVEPSQREVFRWEIMVPD